MGAITALLNSEKAIAGGMLVIASTVLAALGVMPIQMWTGYTQVIFGVYVAGKTVQGTASLFAAKPEDTAAKSKPDPEVKA